MLSTAAVAAAAASSPAGSRSMCKSNACNPHLLIARSETTEATISFRDVQGEVCCCRRQQQRTHEHDCLRFVLDAWKVLAYC